MMPHVKIIPLEGRKIPALHVRRSQVKHLDLMQLTDYVRPPSLSLRFRVGQEWP